MALSILCGLSLFLWRWCVRQWITEHESTRKLYSYTHKPIWKREPRYMLVRASTSFTIHHILRECQRIRKRIHAHPLVVVLERTLCRSGFTILYSHTLWRSLDLLTIFANRNRNIPTTYMYNVYTLNTVDSRHSEISLPWTSPFSDYMEFSI